MVQGCSTSEGICMCASVSLDWELVLRAGSVDDAGKPYVRVWCWHLLLAGCAPPACMHAPDSVRQQLHGKQRLLLVLCQQLPALEPPATIYLTSAHCTTPVCYSISSRKDYVRASRNEYGPTHYLQGGGPPPTRPPTLFHAPIPTYDHASLYSSGALSCCWCWCRCWTTAGCKPQTAAAPPPRPRPCCRP